jgi:hypothetical protein
MDNYLVTCQGLSIFVCGAKNEQSGGRRKWQKSLGRHPGMR